MEMTERSKDAPTQAVGGPDDPDQLHCARGIILGALAGIAGALIAYWLMLP